MSKTEVFAHRGASGYAPENTLDAFMLAIEQGADGIELDVQLSKDGVPVVIHDETVDRVTAQSGFVKDFTLQELKEMEDIPMTKIRRYWHNEPVNIDCKIEDLITTSMNQNFVPVIDDKKIFIGIVTRRDIIQYCYDQVQKENLAR